MRRGVAGTTVASVSHTVHGAVDVLKRFVDRFVPLQPITFVLSTFDRCVPPLFRRIDRVVQRRVKVTDERLIKDTVSRKVDGGEKFVSHKEVPNFITGGERHIPRDAFPSRKMGTIIAGVGKYVPDQVVPTDSIQEWLKLKERFGIPLGMIERLTGVRERRMAADGEASSDMAVRASREAIRLAGMRPEDIDTIIFAAASQDVGEPATANIVQEKLGAVNAHVFDAKNACNSFVNALDIMDAFIQTGRSRVGLVASGEVITRFVKWDIDSKESLKRFMAGLTLGDGGGAMVLRGSNGPFDGRGIQGASFLTDGSQWRLATITAGGNLQPNFDPKEVFFASNGAELDKLAGKYIPLTMNRLLGRLGWELEEVDLVISHQYTENTIIKVAQNMHFPLSKCMLTVRKYGNTASASIPIALSEAIEEGWVGPGSKILLVGGAAGFSAGVVGIVL